MLYHLYKKNKAWIESNQKDLFLAATIVLVSIISFGLGKLSAIWPEKQLINITTNYQQHYKAEPSGFRPTTNNNDETRKNTDPPPDNSTPIAKGKYVASKNSTFYHYPWCPGAQKIKEENKIWFQTKEEAENSGYKPAGNCDGL